MTELPVEIFGNPTWHAMHSRHRHLAVFEGGACRYLAQVAPFGALAERCAEGFRDLRCLMEPGESLWVFADGVPEVEGLVADGTLPTLQMVLGGDTAIPDPDESIEALSDASEMVALTDIAFPGFFRPRTCEMGEYFGIRSGGELVAMGGERLMLDGHSEISGLCTHPVHRGKGHAAKLIRHLARKHRAEGAVSWLHVAVANGNAIELYRRLGFRPVRQVILQRVTALADDTHHPAK